MLIDARGEVCPKPMMMADETLQKMGEGIVEILVDNETAVKNLTWFANKNSFPVESRKEGGDWRVRIAKGAACEPMSEEDAPRAELPGGVNIEPKTMDLRGLQCPEPLKRTQAELELMKEGTLVALVNSPANRSIKKLSKKLGLDFQSSKHGDYYELRIVKTPYSIPAERGFLRRIMRTLKREKEDRTLKDVLLVVGTDTMGKEEELGKILMKAFFETIKVTRELPHTIFFLNAGVKLTTTNDETIPILKDLEGMGVEIFSCGTCLKYYGLEDSLKVGVRGSTDIIVGGLKDFARTVWI